MNLLRRAARALASTTGSERTLYTVAIGYVALGVIEGVRHQNTAAVIGYASAGSLALLCALTVRAARASVAVPGPVVSRGCVYAEFHGGPLDGGAQMLPHSHEPGMAVCEVVAVVDGGRYVATGIEATLYRLEFEAEEATV